MTLHRFAAKRDHLERSVIDALEQMGIGVIPVSTKGGMDLMAWCSRKGWIAIEVKSKIGKLTQAQQVTHSLFPICIVRTVDEAVQLFL